jgi:dipeptidyl aminopeptidase/acylaminoacyl peptidase
MTIPIRELAVAACLFGATGAAAEVPVRDFARLPQYTRVRLSPSGEYLAVSIPKESETGLAIIRLADMKLVAGGQGGRRTHVGNFWWVNDHQVLASPAISYGQLEAPVPTGEFVTLDINTSRLNNVYRRGRSISVHERLESTLRSSEDEVLISSLHFTNSRDDTPHRVLYRLNIKTRRPVPIASAPIPGEVDFVEDPDGELRYAVGADQETFATRTFAYERDKGLHERWREIGRAESGRVFYPLRLSRDLSTLYARTLSESSMECLSARDFGKGMFTALACHADADLDEVYYSADDDVPLAATFEAGAPEVVWLDRKHPDAEKLASLAASFKGNAVIPVSWSDDGSKLLFLVYSDKNPGEFFLYDRETKGAKFLLARSSWIDPAQMAEVRPFQFNSRDGARLFGYLTLPPGPSGRKLPLVVMPHGGPFFVRDKWGWDANAQVLASRGYAVIQVNFRGSGGYGNKAMEAAKGGWGTVMIDDLFDGLKWAIDQGVADPDRVCASGGSYGAYASLMMAVREPDRIKCVVAYAGVYDLQLVRKEHYGSTTRAGRTFLNLYLGDDQDALREQSPLTHIDRLKAPVFIVHGSLDEIAEPEHAERLRSALDKRKHPYEWLLKSGEAHGFYNEDNRTEFYEKQLDFLDRHIGERRPAKAP